MESSKIKPDYNNLLHSLMDDDIDKNVNTANETPDLLLNPNLNSVKNGSKDGIEANERFLKLFKEFRENDKLEDFNEKELFTKLEEKVDLEKIRELLHKYNKEEKEHPKHHVKQHEIDEDEEQNESDEVLKSEPYHHQTNEGLPQLEVETPDESETQTQTQHHSQHHHQVQHHHHRGPHHSIVLDSDSEVKEKIDVEPHYLHPAVAGQEISYHDNVVVPEKTQKQDLI